MMVVVINENAASSSSSSVEDWVLKRGREEGLLQCLPFLWLFQFLSPEVFPSNFRIWNRK